ncbi:MAG: nucleotidyltransferase domain-containing protein [Chloroflexi bacterium]|nr:MAG: nucleotidyltransferase domain-containing protein [Chloroflexota bacterium]
MVMSSMDISYRDYYPYIKKKWEAEQRGWQQRREQAWIVARQAANLLRSEFGARSVMAFGSLIGSGPYDARSDIDLAVSGIAIEDFFRAVAHTMSVSSDFKIDVVDLVDCSEEIRKTIMQKGVEL